MKPWVIVGSLTAAAGAFILLKGISFHSHGTVAMGPFHGSVDAQNWVPGWVGGVAILGGVLLVIAGIRAKN